MTYTFKLAHRLAVSRPGLHAISTCLLLAACAGGDQFSSTEISTTDQLDASARGSKGKKTLVAIELTPGMAELQPGGSQQFTAAGRYSDGSLRSVGVSWSSTGGSVSTGGLYTAGSAEGTYRVTASNGTLADTAAVSVTGGAAPPPPPPPPPSDGGLANECATPEPGWIWCDDFDQDRLGQYFEYQSAGGSFARAAGVGNEGSYGMRARFAAGQVNAGALHLAFGRTPQSYFRAVDGGTRDYREIYWRFYLRHEPAWSGGGGNKLTRAFSFASSSTWAQSMIAHVWSGGSDPAWNHLIVDPASGTDEAGTLMTTAYNDFPNLRWLGATRGATPLFDSTHVGAWYCIEARVRLNDAAQSNGSFDLWVDGAADVSRTGLNWVGAFDGYGLNAVYLENYWNAGSPKAQERYFDNLVVSTARVGC